MRLYNILINAKIRKNKEQRKRRVKALIKTKKNKSYLSRLKKRRKMVPKDVNLNDNNFTSFKIVYLAKDTYKHLNKILLK